MPTHSHVFIECWLGQPIKCGLSLCLTVQLAVYSLHLFSSTQGIQRCALISQFSNVLKLLLLFLFFFSLAVQTVMAFNKNGLLVQFEVQRANNNPTQTLINMKATNSTPFPMQDFVFQAAVPKVIWFFFFFCSLLKGQIFFSAIHLSS